MCIVSKVYTLSWTSIHVKLVNLTWNVFRTNKGRLFANKEDCWYLAKVWQ